MVTGMDRVRRSSAGGGAMLALLGLMAGIGTSSAVADDYAGPLFKRQVVVVADIERALRLYRDVLGFRQDSGINASESTSYTYDVLDVPRGARLRTSALNAGTRQIRTMLLVEVTGVPLPRQTGLRRAAAVVNANGRFAAIIAAVRGLGLPLREPHVLDSVDPKDGRGVEQAFEDWDGNVVLLYEFPPR
jgi:catechol 2,3-dioxygenase-like lactoylglutathione lyase family enzyme